MYSRFILLPVLIVLGCSTAPEEPALLHSFQIQVEGIETPESVRADQRLILKFHGVIGTDLCHRFERFEVNQSAAHLELTLWGIVDVSPGVCATAIAELDEAFTKQPPHSGPISVVINQPDGTSILLSIPITG